MPFQSTTAVLPFVLDSGGVAGPMIHTLEFILNSTCAGDRTFLRVVACGPDVTPLRIMAVVTQLAIVNSVDR